MPRKLTSGELHLMALMKRDAGMNGWAKTSQPVMRMVKLMPSELVEYDEAAGTSRLKPLGLSILYAREWL